MIVDSSNKKMRGSKIITNESTPLRRSPRLELKAFEGKEEVCDSSLLLDLPFPVPFLVTQTSFD